jgi:hypothetical protein
VNGEAICCPRKRRGLDGQNGRTVRERAVRRDESSRRKAAANHGT